MEFSSMLDFDQRIDSLQKRFGHIGKRQQTSGRFFPCIISGITGSGKDILFGAVRKVLREEIGIIISPTESRYLSRPRRTGEENSELNFISREEFEKRNFPFSYEYSENLYGLDTDSLEKELQNGNRSITNGSPKDLAKLFNCLFYLIRDGQLPPHILYTLIGIGDNERLLLKRGGNKEEIQERLNIIHQGDPIGSTLQRIHRYQPYFHIVKRKPSENSEENQEHFNENILDTVERICLHIQKYLTMTPDEIEQERITFYKAHRDSRP